MTTLHLLPNASSAVQWLRARWLRRQGASDAAAVLAAQAADAAERAGDEALAVRALLMRADCLGRQLDPAAASVQSNTVVRAERLGHQGLLRNCHVVSSRLCGYQQQWTAAVVHARDALETAQLIDEAVHCEPLSTLSRAQRQLGLLDDAAANGLQSMRCARLSMDVTDAGNAAMSAMGALLSAYRIDEAMALYRELKRLPGQDALTLYTAVEVPHVDRRADTQRTAGRLGGALPGAARALRLGPYRSGTGAPARPVLPSAGQRVPRPARARGGLAAPGAR